MSNKMIRLGINPATGMIHALTDKCRPLCGTATNVSYKWRKTGGTIEDVECQRCRRLATTLLDAPDEGRTTDLIKEYLGANYTVAEVRKFLEDARAVHDQQAPYFDARLLNRISKLKLALGE